MIVLCPTCKARYKVDETKVPDEGQRLKCPKCTTVFRVKKPAQAAAPPPPPPRPQQEQAAAPPPPPPRPQQEQPQQAAPPPPPKPQAQPQQPQKQLATGPYKPQGDSKGTVLVGDTDDAFLKHVARLMLQNGYTVYLAHDGAVAMELIKSKSPQVAIVDVALPKIYGFEMAEMVKNDKALSERTKMVLLGSVYEKDRYRREPQSFYGADAYIEKHHDGPSILSKVNNLILGTPEEPLQKEAPAPEEQQQEAAPPPPPPQGVAQPEAPPPKPEGDASGAAPQPATPVTPSAPTGDTPPVPDDPDHQKAARLARTIVSDISLYNPELIERGLKEGNVYELLAKDIEDGLKHFQGRVAEEIRSERDYFKEAMDAMLARKKAELGLA